MGNCSTSDEVEKNTETVLSPEPLSSPRGRGVGEIAAVATPTDASLPLPGSFESPGRGRLGSRTYDQSNSIPNRQGSLGKNSPNGQRFNDFLPTNDLNESSISFDIDKDHAKLSILFDCLDYDNDGKITSLDMMIGIAQSNPKLISTEDQLQKVHQYLKDLVAKYSDNKRDYWIREDFIRFMHDCADLLLPEKVLGPQDTL